MFQQDQISRIFWRGPNVSVDVWKEPNAFFILSLTMMTSMGDLSSDHWPSSEYPSWSVWKPFLGSIHPQGTLIFPSFPESIQSVDYPWLYFAPFSFSCLHSLNSLKKKTAKAHQKYLNNQLINIDWSFIICKDLLFN